MFVYVLLYLPERSSFELVVHVGLALGDNWAVFGAIINPHVLFLAILG